MSNRSIRVYEYRQVIMSLGLGESCRAIAKAGLMGRHKAEQIRQIAVVHGWLNTDILLPSDDVLAELLIKHHKKSHVKPLAKNYEKELENGLSKGSKQAPYRGRMEQPPKVVVLR